MTNGLVRVSIASATRRVDLALPSAVPVAELLPELARAVGLFDTTAHGGFRLAGVAGQALGPAEGLADQGVTEGALLTLTTGVVPEPRRYDDLAEAFADEVERSVVPWSVDNGRNAALVTSALSLILGAVALATLRGDRWAAGIAALAAVLLSATAVAHARLRRGTTSVVLACLSMAYAATAGLLLGPTGPVVGAPLAAAGAAALIAGVVCLAGLGEDRVLLLPPCALGVVAIVAGLVTEAAPRDGPVAARLLMVILVAVVLADAAAPALAIGLIGADDTLPIRPELVAADVRTAHRILLALQGAVGAVLVVVTPIAVAQGASGACLATAAAGLVLLRTRHDAATARRLIGLGAGITAGLLGATTALLAHPDWRPAVALLATTVGAGVLASCALPGTARRTRAAELAEGLSTVALLPLLVTATGLLGWIRSGAGRW